VVWGWITRPETGGAPVQEQSSVAVLPLEQLGCSSPWQGLPGCGSLLCPLSILIFSTEIF